MPVTRIPVDVMMERVPLVNRWVSEKWQPAAVVVTGEPVDAPEWPADPPTLVNDTEQGTQWRFARCTIELHPSEGEGYYLNLAAPQPFMFVMWRRYDDGAEPIARPVVVTVSYNQAARMMDGGEQVDPVAMPPILHAWLAEYTERHYKPEPRKKARRNDPFAVDGGRDPAYDAGKIRRP